MANDPPARTTHRPIRPAATISTSPRGRIKIPDHRHEGRSIGVRHRAAGAHRMQRAEYRSGRLRPPTALNHSRAVPDRPPEIVRRDLAAQIRRKMSEPFVPPNPNELERV